MVDIVGGEVVSLIRDRSCKGPDMSHRGGVNGETGAGLSLCLR